MLSGKGFVVLALILEINLGETADSLNALPKSIPRALLVHRTHSLNTYGERRRHFVLILEINLGETADSLNALPKSIPRALLVHRTHSLNISGKAAFRFTMVTGLVGSCLYDGLLPLCTFILLPGPGKSKMGCFIRKRSKYRINCQWILGVHMCYTNHVGRIVPIRQRK